MRYRMPIGNHIPTYLWAMLSWLNSREADRWAREKWRHSDTIAATPDAQRALADAQAIARRHGYRTAKKIAVRMSRTVRRDRKRRMGDV